jgi:serine/threonine protein kinase
MIRCQSCSAELSETSRFCSSCGSVLSPKPDAALGDTIAMAGPPASTPRSTSGRTLPVSEFVDEGRFVPGTLVAERYRVIELLGRGGMGEVYRATDLRLGQQVALKFLPESTAADPDMLTRFNNEVRIARQVSHPNVCRVYDIGEVNGLPYLSMEYVDGEDLGALLRRIGRLPDDTAVEMARKLCAGLAAAHDKGVLHRDLKPANIMIDGRGQVLITDFGLAGFADRIQGAEIQHGTPAYMAPEQLAGKEVTARSDIYSLGLVLYEMFSGKRAYEASTLAEMTRLRNEGALPSLTTHVKDLDPAVERIVKRCLDADPRNRPPSALAVAAALPGGDPLAAALAAGETPSPELVAAANEHEALHPMVALACLAAVLLCLAATPFLVSQSAWITKTPFDTPHDALAQKARDLAQRFGYTEKPLDSAYGMHYVSDYLQDLNRHGKSVSTVAHLSAGQPAPIHFWYRTSPRRLVAAIFGDDGEVNADDPPMDTSGMVKIELDPQGRLVSLEAVPPQVDESPASTKLLDGNALLTAAGLDPARFQPTEPHWTPLAICDQRAAWMGTYPDDPNPLRVEAASWRGKPVYFSLISPWTRPDRTEQAKNTKSQEVVQVVGLTLLCAIVIGACILARHNVRLGRGDWRSAFRLTGFLFALSMASWAFAAHHIPSVAEIVIVIMGLSSSVLIAAVMLVLYVALEPLVRRRWPQTIISWTRTLSGRLRDPVVGGHILAGILFGALMSVLMELLAFFNMRSSGVPSQFVLLSTIRGFAHVTSDLLGILPGSILNTLGVFFLLFLFRVIFRREWIAAAAFVVFLTAITAAATSASALIATPFRFLQHVLMVFVMLRFGLLPFVVGTSVVNLLLLFPVTSDFSAWYAGSALFAVVFVVALAGWAFHTALGGRALFSEKLFDA